MVAQDRWTRQTDTKAREIGRHAGSSLELLVAISNIVGGESDLDELLHASLGEFVALLRAQSAQAWLVDDQGGGLSLVGRQGSMDTLDEAEQATLGAGLSGVVMKAGQPLLVEDAAAHNGVREVVGDRSVLQGYVGIPLESAGRVIGAVNAMSVSPLEFGPGDKKHFLVIGGLLGGAIENAILREELESSRLRLHERVKEISALYDVTRAAQQAGDVEAFLTFVARRLPDSMRHRGASAVIWCSAGGREYVAWSEDLDQQAAMRHRIVPGEGPLGVRLARSETVVDCTVDAEGRAEAEQGIKSLIAGPISVKGEVVGSVSVFYPGGDLQFLEEERQLLYGISEEVAQFLVRHAIELENLRRAQEISSLLEVSKALASVVELGDLLPVIEDTLVETLRPAEAGALLLFDEGTGMLTAESAFGYQIDPLCKISLRVGESISGKVFESGEPGVWSTPEEAAKGMANMTEDNRAFFRQASGGLDHPRSAIGVPLVYREGKIGVITLETLRSRSGLTVLDLPFLQALAELIVINVDKIWLLTQTERTKAMEEANRLKSELIAALAHDMRTPLASIKGYASALLLDDVQWDEETRAEHLRIINEEANELQTMIQDLLESAIIDAGLLEIHKEPTLLPRLAEEAIKEMSRRTAKHEFVLSFPPDFSVVYSDPRRIGQVIRNLVDNAVKYSPEGGLVVVRGQGAGERVIVSVADEGVGIAPEHLNRLFEKFFRVKSPLGHKVKGLGLGLPVARTIVETHGGRIWAESELGKGTTIYFSLPKNDAAAAAGEE